jgi:hypothetical protein
VRHAGLYLATLPLSGSFDGIDPDITMFNHLVARRMRDQSSAFGFSG